MSSLPTNPPAAVDAAAEARETVPVSTPATPVAVIDVGTTSIRMAIAEIGAGRQVRTLESLSQAVSLGKDTFTRGTISKSTIEDCVRALTSYRRVLDEYGITRREHIRVVATSAVREAQNRLSFLDRIYSATGFDIEPIDEAEINRVTYLGILPYLKTEPSLAEATTIVVEVGGGSTEALLVQGDEVVQAWTYRLGSLRLRESLEEFRPSTSDLRHIMDSQIARTVAQIVEHVPEDGRIELIALGGDVRFAAAQLVPAWDAARVARIPVPALEKFVDKIAALSPDQIVHRHHIAFPEAETLAPALLAYLQLAHAFRSQHILVTNFNLRDGLLKDMARRGAWAEDFSKQIVRSAIELGRKFAFDEDHARHVADLSRQLFRSLQDVHRLEPRYELILYIAALLHEIGNFVSHVNHHKHSMYLILNSELFGLSHGDLLLVALVARYHRRSKPKSSHEGYASLDRDRRIAVSKMAALLRVTDALERSHSQRIHELRCEREDDLLVISVPETDDLSLEQLALKQKGALFEEVFGLQPMLRKVGG
ncbi:MAG: Ppx/GppA phosphatase family protein [Planctomycetaceae bacterium]